MSTLGLSLAATVQQHNKSPPDSIICSTSAHSDSETVFFLLTKTKLVINEPNSNSLTKTKTKLSGKLKLTARSEQSIDAMPAPINARCYFVVSHPVLFCSQTEIVCSSCCFDANAILEGLYLYSYSRISVTLQFDVVT